MQTTLVHGGLLCGRNPDDEPCKDEDLPTWHNPFSGQDEPNPYVDFMQVHEKTLFKWYGKETTFRKKLAKLFQH